MMKPLPDLFAVQHAGDRWMVVYPGGHTFARTFERRELRAVDVAPVLLEEPVQRNPIALQVLTVSSIRQKI